jgi:long-chain acyl-CoA synthetase
MNTNPVWFESYPSGVPHNIDTNTYPTLVDLFHSCFEQFGDRNALESFGKFLKYSELDLASEHFAGFLQFQGVEKGDRVAIMLPNILQFPIAMMGILKAGAIVVNVNPLYTARELEHQLKDSGAKTIVILENFVHVLGDVLERTEVENVVVTSLGEMLGVKGKLIDFAVKYVKKMVPAWTLEHYTTFQAALSIGRKIGFTQPSLNANDIAFLQYTGGTTGVSKGAILHHRNLVANILQVGFWVEPRVKSLKDEQSVWICALPLYHIFGLTATMVSFEMGGLSVLIPNPKDIPGFIKILKKLNGFHMFPAVNTLFNALLQHPEFKKLDFSKLLISIGGGMAVQKAVSIKWLEVTGSNIIEGYGLSETSPVACVNLIDSKEFTGTVGLPISGTAISIRNDAGEIMPFNEPGEICIKGPQLMSGYWNRDDETAKVMTPDGFFKSGDVGFMNEKGFVKIIDRKKDMILVSGFNVYPNEIEDVIALMPKVLEVAVVGVPDEHTSEAVKAFIVKKDPSLTEEEVKDYCAQNLTNYKRPKQIVFKESLPKSNVGKILRKNLRQ